MADVNTAAATLHRFSGVQRRAELPQWHAAGDDVLAREPLTGRAGHGGPPAQTVGRVSTAAAASQQVGTSTAIAVNCPPLPGASVRDPGSGGC